MVEMNLILNISPDHFAVNIKSLPSGLYYLRAITRNDFKYSAIVKESFVRFFSLSF